MYTDIERRARASGQPAGTRLGFDRYRLGRRLREVRENLGWTRADVERLSAARWTAAALGTYERGERLMSAASLCAVAEFYGVAPGSLLGPEPVYPPGPVPDGPLVIDTVRLAESGRWPLLAVFVTAVGQARCGEPGPHIVLRTGDLLRLAAAHGLTVELFVERLRRQRVITVGWPAPGSPRRVSVPVARIQ